MRESIRNARTLQEYIRGIQKILDARDAFTLQKMIAAQNCRNQLLKKVLPDLQSMEVSGSMTIDEVLHLSWLTPPDPLPPPIDGEASSAD